MNREQDPNHIPRRTASEYEARLLEAVSLLLDALERCGGDPPDCPDCGPARAFAERLIGVAETDQDQFAQKGKGQGDPT